MLVQQLKEVLPHNGYIATSTVNEDDYLISVGGNPSYVVEDQQGNVVERRWHEGCHQGHRLNTSLPCVELYYTNGGIMHQEWRVQGDYKRHLWYNQEGNLIERPPLHG